MGRWGGREKRRLRSRLSGMIGGDTIRGGASLRSAGEGAEQSD